MIQSFTILMAGAAIAFLGAAAILTIALLLSAPKVVKRAADGVEWIDQQIQKRTVARLQHELVSGDHVLMVSDDEDEVRAALAAIQTAGRRA